MKIVIPTYLRENRQIAYQFMPRSVKAETTLVTHSGRADLLRRSNPGADVLDLGVTDGIADVRQKILDWCESEGHDKVFVVDDGCRFYTSSSDGTTRKIAPTPLRDRLLDEGHYRQMLLDVEVALDRYAQVGISPRPGNNRHLGPVLSPARTYSCYGVNVALARSVGARFDGMYRKDNRLKLFEDFYFSLYLLTRGIPNAVLYDYGFMHDHGKYGGNSTVRTNDLQKLCLESLQAEFPRYVKLVQRKAVSWGIGNQEFRWECVISWKKALTEAIDRDTSSSETR